MTTRIEGRENDDLLSRVADQVRFPTVALLDVSGEPLAVFPEERPIAFYESALARAQRYLELRRRKEAGDDPGPELPILACELERIDFDELDLQLEGAALAEPLRERVERLRASATVRLMYLVLRKRRFDETSREAALEEFLPLARAGVEPEVGPTEATWYWRVLAEHAAEAEDADLLRRSLARLRALLADSTSPRTAALLDDLAKKLEALEAPK